MGTNRVRNASSPPPQPIRGNKGLPIIGPKNCAREAESRDRLARPVTDHGTSPSLKPGGMRELHWHPNSDELQYYIEGEGRMTVYASNTSRISATPTMIRNAKKTMGT